MKRLVIAICLTVVLSVIVVFPAFTAFAQNIVTKAAVSHGPMQEVNKYFKTQTVTFNDGTTLSRGIINGPPKPPPGSELQRSALSLPESSKTMATRTLTVPAFSWVFGCSAVSGAMIAGYYDRNGYPNMYTGPTNGGVMPLNNSTTYWPTWTDGVGVEYPNLPLAASKNGVDGRVTRGSIDDYWVSYNSSADDPYITNGWTQHTWGDAIGDYMKTSQSIYPDDSVLPDPPDDYKNTDGSTTFWKYNTTDPWAADPLTCSELETFGAAYRDSDGTYGRKLFYEARGYTVTGCYTQLTDNQVTGGFSFVQYKAEIDAGRPVMLNLEGHTVVGVGYDDSTNMVYIHDTWHQSGIQTMTWGGSYSDMTLWGVSIVNLEAPPPPASFLYADFTGDGLYQWSGSTWTKGTSSHPASMVASSTAVYADFTGDGLYKWDGSTWTLGTHTSPASMVASSTAVYADFTGDGLYKWDGTTWTLGTHTSPASMVASGTAVYADFPSDGLYKWDGSTWIKGTSGHPAIMVASSNAVYADFTGDGLYKWDGSTWTLGTHTSPASMVASSTAVYADFTGDGLYQWNGSTWTKLTSSHPASMVASSTTLYADFAGDGLYQWSGSEFILLTSTIPASIVAGF